jgi:hypothetical protein
MTMNFGFFTDPDRTRHCYLRLRRLKEAIKDAAILDALIKELQVPSAGAAALSPRQKLAAIERQIDGLRADKTSTWYEMSPPEVLAAAMWSARQHAQGAVDKLFSAAVRKEDLAPPIVHWLGLVGFAPYTQFPPGVTRTDFVAFHVAQFLAKPRIMGIELLNDPTLLPEALARMTACADHTHTMYLACTPATAAAVLLARATAPGVSRWDPSMLRDKLAPLGFGLLIVEGDAVSESLPAKERKLELTGVAKLLKPR